MRAVESLRRLHAQVENAGGIIISMGGQIPNNLVGCVWAERRADADADAAACRPFLLASAVCVFWELRQSQLVCVFMALLTTIF